MAAWWAWWQQPHLIWWALYAITFATGAIVHAWRIAAARGQGGAPLHMWLEMAGLAAWSAGAVVGGMQISGLAAYGGTSQLVRLFWVVGSVLLFAAGGCYMGAAWRNGRR